MKNEETIMVKKPEPLIYVDGVMSHRERKVYNFFLSLIKNDTPNSDGFYYTTYSIIQSLFNIKLYEDIEKIIDNLSDIKVNTNIVKNEKRKFHLISEIRTYGKFQIELSFPPSIIKMVKTDKGLSFAYFNLKIIANFRSRFSVLIYEMIINTYNKTNKYVQIPDLSFYHFQRLVEVGEKTNLKHYLEHKVLKKAKEEIDTQTNFIFDFEFLRKNGSRKYNYIKLKFKYIPNSSKKEIEKNTKKVENLQLMKEMVKQKSDSKALPGWE